jgi:hypothetical protein
MTCHDIDNLISSKPGNALPAPEAAAHLDTCDECRALIGVLNEERKLCGSAGGAVRANPSRHRQNSQAGPAFGARQLVPFHVRDYFPLHCGDRSDAVRHAGLGRPWHRAEGRRLCDACRERSATRRFHGWSDGARKQICVGSGGIAGWHFDCSPDPDRGHFSSSGRPGVLSKRSNVYEKRAYSFDPGSVVLLAASSARGHTFPQADRSCRRWIGGLNRS